MSQTNFELWVKGCQENNTKIYELEECNNIFYYKTWREFLYKNNFYNIDVYFHVWNKNTDKHIYCGCNYIDGYKIYEKETRKLRCK